VFYTIDWSASLSEFPKPQELTDEHGHIIFQIGSGLYGLRKHTTDGSIEFNWDRFQKIASFCRAFEIKLAQGAKQSG
jgi:glutamate synthase domain-containing protein 2